MINTTKALIAVGVGGADEALAYWDEQAGRTENFKTASDIGRLLAALVGYGLQAFSPRYAAMGETVATASTPLLVKSIVKVVRQNVGTPSAFRPRVGVPRRLGLSAPAGAPGGARRVGAQLPEFQTMQLW